MTGKVWLVGAGPGHPDLITWAGLQALLQADVVVYDRLIPLQLLSLCRPDAELVYVGKGGYGGPGPMSQDAINALLVNKAREGKRVVRLKGGDPFVFGRGGEEAEALAAAGLDYAVIPGVTSAIAVPAYAGIPVTHRGISSSVAIVTGHESPEKDEPSVNWGRLANAADTIVVLMGAKTLPQIARELMEHGMSPLTPAAVIYMGTTAQQRTISTTLGDIAQRVAEAQIGPPSVLVVGKVVGLRPRLAWAEKLPLFGLRVVVTRARHQAEALSTLLAWEGAEPWVLPVIEVETLPCPEGLGEAFQRLKEGGYSWTVFTSANAVNVFFHHLADRGLDARALAGVKVAAVGPGTSQALASKGIKADLIPPVFTVEGLARALVASLRPGEFVLWPSAQEANPFLAQALSEVGAQVDRIVIYKVRVPENIPPELLEVLRRGEVDAVTFTSGSTVRHLAQLLGPDVHVLEKVVIACIGPATARAVLEVIGRKPQVIASQHTVAGLVEALKAYWTSTRGGDDHGRADDR